jgi:predicted AAA+ superfamily ATPase
VAPAALLDGPAPRLLDEWQLAPELWNLVRRRVDLAGRRGQFILTGSAVPADDVTRHTGAGRFLRLRQQTTAWYERERPSAQDAVSLASLFEGVRPVARTATIDFPEVIRRLLVSGFPALSDLQFAEAQILLRGYVDEVGRADVGRLTRVRHDPSVIGQLIRSIGRSPGAPVNFTTLARDLEAIAPNINPETVAAYVRLLERLFVVEAQPPWTPRLRSRARLRSTSRLHLADPSLTAVAMGANESWLAGNPAAAGMVFETAAIHDLSVLASPSGAQIRYYRDSYGHEIDAVLDLPDGRWAAVEVKLSGLALPKAVATLTAAVDQLDTEATKPPAFRLIVTGTGPTATIDNQTVTCPLHLLAP